MNKEQEPYIRTKVESPAEITTEFPAVKPYDEWGNPISLEEMKRLALEEEKRINKTTN